MKIKTIQAPAKKLSVTIRGYENDRYCNAIELNFDKDAEYEFGIDLKKVKKALDIVTECYSFDVSVKGYGIKMEGTLDNRYTTMYKANVDTENYRGMTVYTVRLNDDYDFSKIKAYPTVKEALAPICKEINRLVEAVELPFSYSVEDENEQI